MFASSSKAPSSAAFQNCGAHAKTGACREKATQSSLASDASDHLNIRPSPKQLLRHPRLAAASVHLAYPYSRASGMRSISPRGLKHTPQQRNLLAAPASAQAETPLPALRIVVDIIVDNSIGSEASLMISEWGFKSFYASPKTWCNVTGMECYGHDWKQGMVFQWGAVDPKKATRELPEESMVSCDEIPPHLSVVILLTDKSLADEYAAYLAQETTAFSEPEWTDRPVHVHVIGFSERSYKPSEDPLRPLKEVPVTDSSNLLTAALVDKELTRAVEEKIFVSFSSAVPLEGQYEADALVSSLEEVLHLVTEELAKSIVTVEICRHPVPPPGYEFPWHTKIQRDGGDDTYRAIQIFYNGEERSPTKTALFPSSAALDSIEDSRVHSGAGPVASAAAAGRLQPDRPPQIDGLQGMHREMLKKMFEFHIPESELKVYTAAKLDWQFRMACDGEFDPAE
ncbi:hypothetical protein cyc_02698 [Cyclospora cayetanensis]|uniref:Uncharacterized protein n=1 Tax=Cyclospora cayetanensis TaxID=88456 RepID=A0A1D3CY51_9EIME|nr:hypothetical protein cyc_02698 [Cyclospora cayetanensis]